MALIRRLDNYDDWCYGRGKSDYLTNNDCVLLDIKTQLREWKYNCFYNLLRGIDWRVRLGEKNQKEFLDEDILDILVSHEEVEEVSSFTSILDTTERVYTLNASIITIYGNADLLIEIGGENARYS